MEDKTAQEKKLQNQIDEIKMEKNLEISDLKLIVKTKEIEIKDKGVQLKEFSTVINYIKKTKLKN